MGFSQALNGAARQAMLPPARRSPPSFAAAAGPAAGPAAEEARL